MSSQPPRNVSPETPKRYRNGRKAKPSLFNGYWFDEHGKKQRRIYRAEYPELYRLYRICSMYERMDAKR